MQVGGHSGWDALDPGAGDMGRRARSRQPFAECLACLDGRFSHPAVTVTNVLRPPKRPFPSRPVCMRLSELADGTTLLPMSSPSWRAHHEEDLRKDELMKLTTNQQVSVDGVVENNGRWARSQFDSDAMSWNDQAYQRAEAFLFGRRTYDLFAGY